VTIDGQTLLFPFVELVVGSGEPEDGDKVVEGRATRRAHVDAQNALLFRTGGGPVGVLDVPH